MISIEKLDRISDRFALLEARMATGLDPDEYARYSREYSELRDIVAKIDDYRTIMREIQDAENLLGDLEMKQLAQEELIRLRQEFKCLEEELGVALQPGCEDDSKSVVLEIRAGTGGEEAALFAADLLRMYERFAEREKWTFEVVARNVTELGGVRDATVVIGGNGVFGRMKFESGVHRVQRIPATESHQRIHTSAATVAVLPVVDDVDIRIAPDEIRIDTMRASGAGGQHVNKTDSAVRITHIPTGISATSSEKSQHRNRVEAMRILKSRLYEREQRAQANERALSRKEQVGTGDRSERIRTYNFPQGRLTDHRIKLTLYKLDQILQGNLGDVVNALVADDRANRLSGSGT
ncbi:MAG: peptide chain release factor 1 [Rhodobacteraceae bacterium]|nr:peptide chain release factor 1 [Paracoccaceae bacterium]MCY4140912.1 peptide chain release factor 1 [Paracoccaceae bacterium]